MLDSDIRPEVGEALTVGRQDVVSRGRLQRGRGSLLPGGQGMGSGSGNGRHDESTGIRDLAPCQRSVRLCRGALGTGWSSGLWPVERYHSERNSQFKTNTQPIQT